jgi:recombination protein RecA
VWLRRTRPRQGWHPWLLQDRDKSLDAALAQIDRQFGKGSVMRLGDEVRSRWRSSRPGPSPRHRLGIGGLPRGRVVEIYGPESSGKTTVALHAIANAQKAGGIAAFIDAEHALDPDLRAEARRRHRRAARPPSRTPVSRRSRSPTC